MDYSSSFHPTDLGEVSRFGSGDHAMGVLRSLLRVVGRIEEADHHYAVHRSLERLKKIFGVDQASFCWLESNPATGATEAIRTHSSSGKFVYDAAALGKSEAVQRFFRNRREPVTAAQLGLQDQLPEGIQSLLLVPARASGDVVVGCLMLLSRKPAYFDANPHFCRLACSTIAEELCVWSFKSMKERRTPEGGLTEAERELLRWEAQGQKTKQMVKVTGESVAAVDHRWSKLNRRLGVKGRAAAVRVAQVFSWLD